MNALVRLLAFVLLALVLLVAPAARAQTPPQMSTMADAEVVGVGETVAITIKATHDTESLSNPSLGATPGFSVVGRSVNVSIGAQRSVSATWTLRAQRTGTFSIGPPTVELGAQRYAGRAVSIRVVPKGQAPARPSASASDPTDPFGSAFDPWKGLFQFQPPASDDDPLRPLLPQVPTDSRLALPATRGSMGFLHAEIDKTAAVVGEQVTLSMYYYSDASLPRFPSFGDDHDPATDDFISHPLLQEGTEAKLVGHAEIGGIIWQVRLFKKVALFPLKTGDLEVGPMTVTLERRRAGEDPHRSSESFKVHVTEPPLAGRPPGYAVGDVGRFALSADVSPREAENSGAVAVNVELAGTGSLPSMLTPPARADVEWLDPQVHDALGAQGERWGGKRTFAFIVRPHHEGKIDLGELALPYYDPDTKHYSVARAPLGSISVKPGAATPAAESARLVLAGLPAALMQRAAVAEGRRHVADTPLYWLGLLASPLAFVAAMSARAATRNLRRRREERAASPETELKARVAAASAACKNGDARLIDAAVGRALEAATVARAGVSVRGVMADDVAQTLETKGVAHPAARELEDLLRECEASRFAPDASDLASAKARWNRAREAIEKLGSRR